MRWGWGGGSGGSGEGGVGGREWATPIRARRSLDQQLQFFVVSDLLQRDVELKED